MTDINKYLAGLQTLASDRNSRGFAQDIALPFVGGAKRINRVHLQLIESCKRQNIESICNSRFRDSNLSAIVCHRLQALSAIAVNDYLTAYREVNNAFSSCFDYVSNGENEVVAWLCLTLVRLSDDLRIVAGMADKSADDAHNASLRESVNTITKAWTIIVKDRAAITDPCSKKRVLLALTNVMFKVYFTLNSLSLCNKLIDIVEGPTCKALFENLDLIPVCDVVMYKYYYGRLMMFEDKYENSRDFLRTALRYCPKSCFKNRQRILASLIPVEMCLGVLPSFHLATHYGFGEFAELAQAAKRGDIKRFDEILQDNRIPFIKVGIYLVLEQVRMLTVRNFFKRVCFIVNSSRISLETVELAHRLMQPNTNLDQIECLLANLIFQGKVKGYMSHEKKMLIVSKADPFPSKAVVTKWTPK